MFGLGKAKSVPEHEADGEIERVYHEIRQVLRVTGVNLNFRTWATYPRFLPAMWEAVLPNAETRAFEEAADRVRAEAARAGQALGRVGSESAPLGASQAWQVRAALDLYHYINPKLLVLTSAVRLALAGERVGGEGTGPSAERIERGPPAKMYPMEMEAERPEDGRLQELFEDIKKTLSLSSVNSDYRTLALWPEYLAAAWRGLKPITQGTEYARAADQLRETARTAARSLPHPVPLTPQKVDGLGEDADAVARTTEQFERLLPGLVINIALLVQDWRKGDAGRSPFPAAAGGERRGGGS